MSSESVGEALLDAKSRLEEVSRASHQNIDDALKRYAHALSRTGPVGTELAELLPAVDFNSWYQSALATKGGMVGSAKLNWPLEPEDRVALQYELVHRIAAEEIDLTDFTYTFTHEANNFNANNYAFFERVLVPFHNDLVRIMTPLVETENEAEANEKDKTNEDALTGVTFVDPIRVSELKSITSDRFDLTRVIQYCVELESAYRGGSYLAVGALTRALIDHVPPIFECGKFSEVADNYAGAKSFKDSMKILNSSARKIGDAHLHTQIRRSETLPTATQVNFSSDVDVLLAEIVRILK